MIDKIEILKRHKNKNGDVKQSVNLILKRIETCSNSMNLTYSKDITFSLN